MSEIVGACTSEHCVTCGDVAETMRVLRVDHERGLALCADSAGDRHPVEIALVPPVAEGDGLLVHAGTAIAVLGRGSSMQVPRRSRGQGVLAGAEEAVG